tara:strand:+ start:2538 stop:4001 length:1464 start_codon:yes stop_codon:yes gene_type:complete
MANVIPSFGAITPSQQQQALSTNYLQFNNPAGANFSSFAQQYLPEIYEQEVERYGNRTLSGFLRMVGAEMPMTSDQVIWSEQNRLHVAYTNVTKNVNDVSLNIPLNAVAGPLFVDNVISVQDTIVIMNPTTGQEVKALVTASVGSNAAGSANGVITVATYTGANLATALGSAGVALAGLKIFVYGSEYRKGTNDNNITSITPSFTQFSNSPIIIKDRFEINGSDMAQIGWIEVATEDGTSGYLWYLKAESETRLRFEDYLEMAMVEGELAAAGSGVIGLAPAFGGTEGLFAAVQNRGNVLNNFTATAGLGEFDSILKNLDTQGAIEENMLFLNRKTSLDFDDMLSQISSGAQGGTAFGLFENSEEMALNLGFSGFRRGSYDFYKTDWKYLNDASTRGGMQVSGIDGVLIPAGTSTVYDQILGSNIRRPFLHVRYRASETEDRRMKSWITGSAGGAYTTGLDSMVVHFLSERCLCVQGANNFVLFTAS